MADWPPRTERPTPKQGSQRTGYAWGPPPGDPPGPPPDLRKHVGWFEIAKWITAAVGLVFTVLSVVFYGGRSVEKIDRMYEEQRLARDRDEQRTVDDRSLRLKVDNLASAQAASVVQQEKTADQVKRMNEVLRRIAITRKAPPEP